jgi:hypothetical protein
VPSLPPITPREAWAPPGREPAGPPEPETTRFLLVHHTATSNDYEADSVPLTLRGILEFHTGKGWRDVAYNFFVDRYGGAWEGRAGSLAGPVVADATGGNQGYAQLVCLIGNHEEEPPTDAAITTLVELLAWLAERDGVDTSPGAVVDFVSRGSNLWPAGTEVRTRTIAGHREMSRTLCPGTHVVALLDGQIPTRVRAARTR